MPRGRWARMRRHGSVKCNHGRHRTRGAAALDHAVSRVAGRSVRAVADRGGVGGMLDREVMRSVTRLGSHVRVCPMVILRRARRVRSSGSARVMSRHAQRHDARGQSLQRDGQCNQAHDDGAEEFTHRRSLAGAQALRAACWQDRRPPGGMVAPERLRLLRCAPISTAAVLTLPCGAAPASTHGLVLQRDRPCLATLNLIRHAGFRPEHCGSRGM